MVTQSGVPSRPSALFYFLGVLIILAGAGIFVVTLVGGLTKITGEMSRVVVPGEVTFPCQPGAYTIYHEYESTMNGKVYQAESIAGMSVNLKDGGGNPVALGTPFGSSRYQLGSRAGRSIFAGRVVTGGACTLTAGYPSGSGPETVVAIGRGLGGAIVKIIAVGGISMGAGITIGTIVIVMTARRRRRLPARASNTIPG
jgi:hypothetical protein